MEMKQGENKKPVRAQAKILHFILGRDGPKPENPSCSDIQVIFIHTFCQYVCVHGSQQDSTQSAQSNFLFRIRGLSRFFTQGLIFVTFIFIFVNCFDLCEFHSYFCEFFSYLCEIHSYFCENHSFFCEKTFCNKN